MRHYERTISDAQSQICRIREFGHRLFHVTALALLLGGGSAVAQQVSPITTCDTNGIGQAQLVSDLPTFAFTNPPNDTSVTITSVSTGTTGGIGYCLVKLLVKPSINIWVGLPTGGKWNGRLQSEGGGGYAGSVGIATGSISARLYRDPDGHRSYRRQRHLRLRE